MGQVAGTPLCDPSSVPALRDDWVGRCPTVEVQANGVTINCLVDTGSQVTLFSESLAQELFADRRLQAMEASQLTLRGANGLDIPYTGYIVVDFFGPRGSRPTERGCYRSRSLLGHSSSTPRDECYIGLLGGIVPGPAGSDVSVIGKAGLGPNSDRLPKSARS